MLVFLDKLQCESLLFRRNHSAPTKPIRSKKLIGNVPQLFGDQLGILAILVCKVLNQIVGFIQRIVLARGFPQLFVSRNSTFCADAKNSLLIITHQKIRFGRSKVFFAIVAVSSR